MAKLKKSKNSSIGVFDSGLGGLSVLSTLKQVMPNEKYIYYGDSLNAPYGTKSTEQVIEYSDNIVNWFLQRNVKALVIACNSATSAAANHLRAKYDIPIIGMEPAIKPAIKNLDTKKIAVMATELTLREKKFENLIENIALDSDKMADIIRVPCPALVELVEHGILSGDVIENEIKKSFANSGISDLNFNEIDAIVLGCTHFSFLKESIINLLKKEVSIFDGNMGTALHLKRILEQNNLINEDKRNNANIEIYNSMSNDMIEKSWDIINIATELSK